MNKELADYFRERDRLALAAGKPTIMVPEEIRFASDGHREWMETVKTPIWGPDANLIGVLGIGRNITDRRKSEDEVARSRVQLQAIIDNAGVAIGLNDPQGRFLSVNAKFGEFLGTSLGS